MDRDPSGNFNQYIHNRTFLLWRIAAMKISRLTDPKGMFNIEREGKLESKSDSDLWNKRIDSANRRIFFPWTTLFLFFFLSPRFFYFFPVTSVPMTFTATLCACSLIGAYKTTLNKHSRYRGNVTSRTFTIPYRFPSNWIQIDRIPLSQTRNYPFSSNFFSFRLWL